MLLEFIMLSRVLFKSRGHKYHSSLTIHHLEGLNKFQVEDFMNILTIFLCEVLSYELYLIIYVFKVWLLRGSNICSILTVE